MNLTAKLAYSQLKVNRSRTLWTLMGIILSTALITAVCSFTASGNALAVDLLGEDYGGHIGTIIALLLFPASILSAIIITMSVVVISNAFRVSAGERIAQFGVLKSIGATKKQITATVVYESIFLSSAGIPVGIITGLIVAFTGVQVANLFLGELNSLVHMMMKELIIVIDFVIAWPALMAAAMISFLTVLFSAWLPARKAAKITAIESIRGRGEVKTSPKRVRTVYLTQKLFGLEGMLAAKNMKRNKRNFRASVISLTVGVVLFINLSALSGQAAQIEGMLYPDVSAQVMVEYISSINEFTNEVTGREESTITTPINSELAEAVTGRLRKHEGTVIFGAGSDMETYDAIIPDEMISPRMMETYFYSEKRQEYELSAEIKVIDKENYAVLCERAGVSVGSNILLNRYDHNDNGNAEVFAPFQFEKQNIRLIKADGSVHEMPVHGVLTQEDIPNELLAPNTNIVRLLVPDGNIRGYSWYADSPDIDSFMDYADVIMNEFFPHDYEAAYMEPGFNTRVFKIDDYMKIMNIGIVLAMVFVYSFVVLLSLIGFTNIISTMSANIRMRAREFAVLQSVGMTRGGLKRMTYLESIMCSVKSLIIGLPLAIILTYLINIPIRSAFPIPYQFPWLAIVWCSAIAFVITGATMRYSVSRLRNVSIADTIRGVS